MADHIKIRPATGTWVIRAGGAVLGETDKALELAEGDYTPVIYIPKSDIAMALLDPSDTTSHCPYKGDATYFSIVAKSGVLKDSAWGYDDPKPGLEAIKDHLAFYGNVVAVEQV